MAAKSEPEDASRMRSKALDLGNRGELSEAIELLRECTSRYPAYSRGLATLGNFLHASGQTAEAEALLDDAIRAEPGEWAPRLAMAGLLSDTKRDEQALALYEKVVEEHPNSAVLSEYADYLISRGKPEKGLELALRASNQEPTDLLSVVALAKAYWSLERYRDAEEAFRRALSLDASSRSVRFHFGRFLGQFKEHFDEARQHLEFAAALKDRRARAELDGLNRYISEKRHK